MYSKKLCWSDKVRKYFTLMRQVNMFWHKTDKSSKMFYQRLCHWSSSSELELLSSREAVYGSWVCVCVVCNLVMCDIRIFMSILYQYDI